MKPLTLSVCDEREGVRKAGGLLSSGALDAISNTTVECVERNSNCVPQDNLAGQGIKAARGNKVCGQDRVSVKLEAPSRNVWEARPLSEQHFKGTEAPL